MEDTQQPSAVEHEKLTDWKNEPTLTTLKYDFEQAKPSHDKQQQLIDNWRALLRVTGKAKPPTVKGRSSVQPKLIRRQVEWRYSALTEPFLSSQKLFQISPVTFEDGDAARQNELVLNWQFRTKMNKVKLIDDLVRATCDDGTGLVRLGWRRVTKKIPKMVPTFDHFNITNEQDMQVLQQAIEMKSANPRGYEDSVSPAVKAAVTLYEEQGLPTVAVQSGERQIMEDFVLENRPTVEMLNPANVYIDPSCNGDIERAMFIALTFETSYAEMKADPKYKNLDKVLWDSAGPMSQPDHATTIPDNFNFSDKSRRKVVAYEYWGFYDIEGNGELQPFVATWIGNVLVRMELNPFPDGKLPFVMIPYMPLARDLYGEPDAELLEDNQKVLGAVMRGMIDLMGRSANAQQGFAKGMLDPLNRRRLEAGDNFEFNPNSHPNNGMVQFTYPEIPQSAMLMLNLQNQEAEGLTGVKSFSGGVSGAAYGDVAAGIRGALDAASKREMAILRRVAKGVSQIGEKIVAMNAEFMTEEEVIRVTNKEFVKVKREDLKGNFDMEVDISTAEIDNAKAQDMGFMLQTLGPNMDPGITMMILSNIATLKRMPELAEQLRNYRPQPDPTQEQLKQLEVQAKQMEIQKLQSEIIVNQAKAKQLDADADKKNLDFVEQESGTAHERDMQKQKGQAQGNQDLEITKALLNPGKKEDRRPDVEAAIGYNQLSDNIGEGGGGVISPIDRDQAALSNPALSLGSSQFNAATDPALNPAINI